MKTLGNILWFFFGGLETALMWLVFGLLWCVTIVGIPFGRRCFRIAGYSLQPIGKIVNTEFGKHPVANTVSLIFGGGILALFDLIVGLLWVVTIIGIPYGLQSFRFAELACFPFGSYVY